MGPLPYASQGWEVEFVSFAPRHKPSYAEIMNPILALLGPLGPAEITMILVLIMFLFGAKKLPELARGMGRSLGEFKRGKEEFEDEITRAQEEVTKEDEKKDS